MATTVRVKNKKTGLERDVTLKAYRLFTKKYTALAFFDKEGNQVEDPALTPVVAKTVKKKPVELVEDKPEKRPQGRPRMTDEERAAKKLELTRLNEEAIERAKQKTAK